jgi:two-component system, OmpR family, alkaline phosphatase synthesis response regulator PhoP
MLTFFFQMFFSNNVLISLNFAPMKISNTAQKKNILLVEDEISLHDIIKLNLEIEGFAVLSAFDGKQALELFKSTSVSCVVLDIMMPYLDGFEVCKEIKVINKNCPIIFLSARSTIEDKIKGLEIGGDDYLTKPFHFKELLLRIEKLIERNTVNKNLIIDTYRIGVCTIDYSSFRVTTDTGIVYDLTERQLNMLALLIEKKNQVVSRVEILQKIWKFDIAPNSRTIDNVILLFRKIFEETSGNVYFKSIRGVGYMFEEK